MQRKTNHYADPPVPQDTPADPDAELKAQHHELGQQILSWWRESRSYMAENRELMDRDSRFYCGDQWTPEDLRELESRGQCAAVYNLKLTLTGCLVLSAALLSTFMCCRERRMMWRMRRPKPNC